MNLEIIEKKVSDCVERLLPPRTRTNEVLKRAFVNLSPGSHEARLFLAPEIEISYLDEKCLRGVNGTCKDQPKLISAAS